MTDRRPSIDAHIRITGDTVHVALGATEASVPVGQLEAFIRTLEAARLLAGGATEATGPDVTRPAASAKTPASPRRRSRKRVGDALVAWMRIHPGWHHEDALLKTTIDLAWTDAQPLRALKIALGKGRNTTFDEDGRGHWKLCEETTAGPPPKRRGSRKGRTKRSTNRNSSNTRALAPRKEGRARKSGAKARAKASAPKDVDRATGRQVLVKKGQDRKHASMPEGEREARQRASENVSRQAGRWAGSGPSSAVARAKRNLLGIGPTEGGGD